MDFQFLEITETSSVHWDELNFNIFLFLRSDDDITIIRNEIIRVKKTIIKYTELTIHSYFYWFYNTLR